MIENCRFKIINLLIIICLNTFAFGQVLFTNGDFENYTTLPNNSNQVYNCIGLTNPNGHIGTAPGDSHGTPDYYVQGGYNNSFYGRPTAYSGIAQIGMMLWIRDQANFREYVSGQLDEAMVQGNTYRVSFYIHSGNQNGTFVKGFCNNFGIYFSENQVIQQTNEPITNYSPQIEITDIINTNNEWVQYSFLFTSNGNFNHFAMGNFRNDANTTFTTVSNHIGAYYFVDSLLIERSIPTGPSIVGEDQICAGDSTTLSAINTIQFSWANSNAPSDIISNNQEITVAPTQTSTYLLYAENDTISFTVNVVNPPSVNLGQDVEVCEGEVLTLNAQNTGSSFLWQDGSTLQTFTALEAGTYWVEVDNGVCKRRDSINISFIPFPEFTLGEDTTLCEGEILTLDLDINNAVFQWIDNSTTNSFTINSEGNYWVNVTSNNCTKSDSISVLFVSKPEFSLGEDTTLCQGDSLLLLADYPNGEYLWQDGNEGQTYWVTESGDYALEINNNGCVGKSEIIIDYILEPQNIIPSDSTICKGDLFSIDLGAIADEYLWSDGSDLSSFTTNETGEFSVLLNMEGCMFNYVFNLTFESCDINLNIPNVFSPNGDGINDKFEFEIDGYKTLTGIILNRWGKVIYEWEGFDSYWDGGESPAGVYFYIVNAVDITDKAKELKGTITLIK